MAQRCISLALSKPNCIESPRSLGRSHQAHMVYGPDLTSAGWTNYNRSSGPMPAAATEGNLAAMKKAYASLPIADDERCCGC